MSIPKKIWSTHPIASVFTIFSPYLMQSYMFGVITVEDDENEFLTEMMGNEPTSILVR
jgi:hypothetical protein